MTGTTLNDAIIGLCGRKDYKLILDKKILKEYEDPDDGNLFLGLGNLIYELDEHRKYCDKKVISKLEKNTQIIELLSSGSSLDEETLNLLNERYSSGARSEYQPYKNGSKIAAYFLAKLNGTVCIENCNEDNYTVKNIVKLPA